LKGNPVIGLILAKNGLFFDLCRENLVQKEQHLKIAA